jgi:CDP-6-deoxy-D-xylo-4-hexulose-3-dehydrase
MLYAQSSYLSIGKRVRTVTDHSAKHIRKQIGELVKQFYSVEFADKEFIPGKTPVPVSGRVFDEAELCSLVESALDFWLTTGRFAKAFETRFSEYIGAQYALLVNSGSSANLLAISALTSPRLGEKRLRPGDEVITVAAGFPTTVNPIIQNNLVPVFVDISIPTYNALPEKIESALSSKTRAIVLAHTLGNPFDVESIRKIAHDHHLWLVEDCCDALGSLFNGQIVGQLGDLSTFSFYPAHHITMGEGGCVVTNNPDLKQVVQSFRDWGRDCWCDPGQDNCCGKRFKRKNGELPEGYDHKYVYSHIGYNLKATDMQAAVGVAQLDKIHQFLRIRSRNHQILNEGLGKYEHCLILPRATENSDPAWFGFPITLSSDAPFSRADLLAHLNSSKIGTRLLFGGNLIKQPAYRDIEFRNAGRLCDTDRVMNDTFWIGNYPGLTSQMLEYVIGQFEVFMKNKLS